MKMDEGNWRQIDLAALKSVERAQLGLSHLSSERQKKCIVNVTASTIPSLVTSRHDASSFTKHFSVLFCLVISEVM